jgi:hypothetical protein
VLGPELVRFIEGGCGLVVATVSADGMPRATRGWSAEVLDPEAGLVRFVVGTDDPVALDDLAVPGRIAVTGADVRSLRSVQLKGRVTALAPLSHADRARVGWYCDTFFEAVRELDGNPRELLDRLVPSDFVACVVAVDEVYDQTPGPGAGGRLSGLPA